MASRGTHFLKKNKIFSFSAHCRTQRFPLGKEIFFKAI